jgi:hypothetical protein
MESEPLAPGDAAWLLILVQNAVPRDQGRDPSVNWEGAGRQHAYELLSRAAGVPVPTVAADEISRISDAVSVATNEPGRTVFVEGQQ